MPHLFQAPDLVQRLRGHWRRSLAEPLWGRSAILVLHRILPDEDSARLPHNAPYCLGPDSFRQLIKSLAEHTHITSLRQARRLHRDPVPRIALTFDGGWRDSAEVATPILDHLALPASIFLPPGQLGQPCGFWWAVIGDALWQQRSPARVRDVLGDAGLPTPPMPPALPDKAYSRVLLSYLEMLRQSPPRVLLDVTAELHARLDLAHALDAFSIRRLESGGLIRFGAHGVLGQPLEALEDAAIRQQIRNSRRELAAVCRDPLATFAYGDSIASPRVQRIAQECGVREALSSGIGWISPQDAPLALPRIPISQPIANSPGRLYDWLIGHL
ncbi:polysaccharide deacetylase family protein [Halomonas sp. WWR20]